MGEKINEHGRGDDALYRTLIRRRVPFAGCT